MERCNRCGRTDEEVKLFDGLYVNEPVRICEKCSIISNIPIIKRPTPSQLKTSETAAYNVRKRLSALAGLDKEDKTERTLSEELRRFQDNPEIEKPEDLVFKLVDNFHWVIQTERRRKGLYPKQLAESIGESESAIKMLEKGIVPNNAMELVQKIEQFLKIKLIKKDSYEKMLNQSPVFESRKNVVPVSKQIVLLPEKTILEPSMKKEERKKEVFKEEAEDMVRQAIMTEKNVKITSREKVDGTPLNIGSFRKDKIDGINVADFKRMEDNAQRSFEIENMKTRAEISREQVEGFGNEDTEKLKRKIYGADISRVSESVNEKIRSGKTPSIYELMRLKEEKKKQVVGREIVIENRELEPKKTMEIMENLESREEARKKGIISNLKEIFGFSKNQDKIDVDIKTGKLIE
jgi:ribosome-binding protein aMBF1 (putative translation factor)